jgi:hypothetical protein
VARDQARLYGGADREDAKVDVVTTKEQLMIKKTKTTNKSRKNPATNAERPPTSFQGQPPGVPPFFLRLQVETPGVAQND